MTSIRAPSVAGMFYPASPRELRADVERMLDEARARALAPGAAPAIDPAFAKICPKALIVPHAGYVYSGPIAATAYARVAPFGAGIRRVVVVGPAHRVPIDDIASAGAEVFRTPLGDLEADTEALGLLSGHTGQGFGPPVPEYAIAHAFEHSVEVQMPYIQTVTPHARLVALVAGHPTPSRVSAVLEAVWGGSETLVLISSDLSHYLPYSEAKRIDRHTADEILSLHESVSSERACGSAGINGLLVSAKRHKLSPVLLDLRNSGDTHGPHQEVVGYGAFAFYPSGVP